MVGIGYLEGCLFVGLERDLLRQHHVADRQVTVGSEAPDGDQRTMFAEFIDVQMWPWCTPSAAQRTQKNSARSGTFSLDLTQFVLSRHPTN
jgi:hypothetical protein